MGHLYSVKTTIVLVFNLDIKVDQMRKLSCVSDFPVSMEDEQTLIIHFRFQEGVSSTDIHAKLESQFGGTN
jgi:hypothetical protein